MYVVLDTNILYQEGLDSRNMGLLERLAQEGRVTVCVPELVLQEFITHKVNDARDTVGKSKALFPEVQKKLGHTALAEIAKQLATLTEEFEQELQPSFTKAVDEWQDRLKVKVLKFDPQYIDAVFADYFSGKGAFRAIKKRDDIPDSFIAYSILTLVAPGKPMTVVVKDGVLRKHLATKRVSVSDGLSELFATEPVRTFIEQSDKEAQHLEGLKALLASEKFTSRLRDFVANDSKGLENIFVEVDEDAGSQALEMAAFGIQINGPTSENVSGITLGEVSYIGPGNFSVAIKILADVYVAFVASYMDYINLPQPRDELVEMTSMNGDGWADLHELRSVEFHGYLQLRFDTAWSAGELEQSMTNLNNPDSAIQVLMDINDGTVL